MAGIKQTEFARDVVEVNTIFLDLMSNVAVLEAILFANGYDSSGDNAFVDADFPAEDRDLSHLTAADFYNAVNALLAIKATYDANGNNTAIAKAATGTIRR